MSTEILSASFAGERGDTFAVVGDGVEGLDQFKGGVLATVGAAVSAGCRILLDLLHDVVGVESTRR